jgi:hypothetical protein
MAIGLQDLLNINPDLQDGAQIDDGDISVLSHSGGQTPDLVLGNSTLGLTATFEQDPGGGDAPDNAGNGTANIDVLSDIGHGRIESLTLHVLGTDVGGSFAPGVSASQPSESSGSAVDANALNGLDGNNIQNLFVHGPARLDVVWSAEDGNPTQSSADGSTIAHSEVLDGLGGGPLDHISLGLPLLGQDNVYTFDNPLPGGDLQPVEVGSGDTGVSLFGGGSSDGSGAPGGDLLSGLNLPVVPDLLGGLSLDQLPALNLLSQATGGGLALDHLPVVSDLLDGGLALDHLPVISDVLAGGLGLDNIGADLPVVSQVLGGGLSLDTLPGLDLLHVGDILPA